MAIKVTVGVDEATKELLSVYYQLSDEEVDRTAELDENCMVDFDSINRPVGLEIVGPFDLLKAKESAAIYCSPELDQVFMLLGGERNMIRV